MSLDREAVARIIAATKLDGPAIDHLKLPGNWKELAYDLELNCCLWLSATEKKNPVITIVTARAPHQPSQRRLFRDRSQFEYFAGHGLPKIYEKYFERPAGISHVGDDVDGPFVRFADQALIELGFEKKGQPYSHGSIKKALNLARGDKSRRK